MAKAAGPRFPCSLWDRLTDPESVRAANLETSRAARLERLRREVLTHVEWLLNSRRPSAPTAEDSDELLKGSLAGYGLPDLSAVRLGDPRDRDRLKRTLAEVIERFEPRLRNVRVELDADRGGGSATQLHYRVRAVIQVKPIDQPVEFDTVLDLGGKAVVEGAG